MSQLSIITAEFVRQLSKQLAEVRHQIDVLELQADGLETVLSGAQQLCPEAFEDVGDGSDDVVAKTIHDVEGHDDHDDQRDHDGHDADADDEDGKRVTLPAAIVRALEGDNRGFTRIELRNFVAKGSPTVNLGRDGVYFYRAVRRMIDDGRIRETKAKRLKLST